MDCDAFQQALPELLYGELPADERPAAEAHAQSCPECGALLEDLRPVPGSLKPLQPSPLLNAKIRLAGRDLLLERPDLRVGGLLHRWALVLLVGLIAAVSFTIGVYVRETPDEAAPPETLPIPDRPLVDEDPPEPAGPSRPAPPRAPQAWQRVLFDAAREAMDGGDAERALQFFTRADAVCADGPLAGEARLGRAEALVGLDRPGEAREALRALRADVLGGVLPPDPTLLQRVQELEERIH